MNEFVNIKINFECPFSQSETIASVDTTIEAKSAYNIYQTVLKLKTLALGKVLSIEIKFN